jgi:hypothetical protein
MTKNNDNKDEVVWMCFFWDDEGRVSTGISQMGKVIITKNNDRSSGERENG